MTEAVNALTDQQEPTIADLLEEQETEWGDSGLDEEQIFAEIDELQEEEEEETEDEEEGEDEGSEEEETAEDEEPDIDALLENAPREGTGDVLNRLVETDPGAARLMRGMQRQMSQMFNERGEVKDVLDRLVSLEEQRAGESGTGDAEPEKTAEETLQERGITQDQVDNFKAVADALGLAYGEDLETAAAERAANEREDQEALQGIKLYGDAFGYIDENGQPQVNPEVQEAMDAKMQELTDPKKGVTTLDIFKLVNPQARPKGPAPKKAAPRPKAKAPARRRASSKANTVKRSVRSSGVRIYDPKRGDSGDDVLDRAWALSKRDELDYENQ